MSKRHNRYRLAFVYWEYEDELPNDLLGLEYDAMYPMSKLSDGNIGARKFPYIVRRGEKIFLGDWDKV